MTQRSGRLTSFAFCEIWTNEPDFSLIFFIKSPALPIIIPAVLLGTNIFTCKAKKEISSSRHFINSTVDSIDVRISVRWCTIYQKILLSYFIWNLSQSFVVTFVLFLIMNFFIRPSIKRSVSWPNVSLLKWQTKNKISSVMYCELAIVFLKNNWEKVLITVERRTNKFLVVDSL